MSPRSIETLARAAGLGGLALAMTITIAGCGSDAARRADSVAATGEPAPDAVVAFERALATIEGGDAAGAEAELQRLADAHPDYSGPLVNLAIIRSARQDDAAASALLERAVAVCAQCAVPWNELGVVQRRQGRFSEAEQSYLRALAADPGYAPAAFNLGVLYELYLQRPDLALDNYQRFRGLQAADAALPDVDKWIADLERRARPVERAARAEPST